MTHTLKVYKDDTLHSYMGTEGQRKAIIDKIRNTFVKAKERDTEIDQDKLCWVIMADHGVTEKKAKEYIKLALITLEKDAGVLDN